jgi:hypothetical protein
MVTEGFSKGGSFFNRRTRNCFKSHVSRPARWTAHKSAGICTCTVSSHGTAVRDAALEDVEH